MPDRRWTGPWRRHGRRSWLRPPPRGRAPCSIAPPVGRVGSVVLPEGPIGCIARRFEITPERLTHLVPSLARLLLGSNGRRNSARANDREKGTLNGVIHPQPAKR